MNNYVSPAEKIGELLARELAANPHFYFFSPDETTSNKFDAVFGVEKRAWALPVENWDLPEAPDGRIVELLSENVLLGVMMGHLTNGEPAMFGSYEAFFPIVTGQLLQQLKFIKQSKQVPWRAPLPAVNLLSTSTCWRQDHNGFTHQSPALISTLLDLPSNLSNCFFPLDAVAAEAAFRYMMNSTDVLNLTTFNKVPEPVCLNPAQAAADVERGYSIFDSAPGEQPDIIFVAAGDLVAKEALLAIQTLRQDLPELKVRFIYLGALSYRAIGTTEHKLSQRDFDVAFTTDRPIIANFHGYPATLTNILATYTDSRRLHVHGYEDEGSTTTPFEMLRRNHASRYDLAIDVANLYERADLARKYQEAIEQNHAYAVQNGEDMLK